ncbi:MAG TPA: SDR family NAD(P)-dependent oxidoreductase [Chloroflexota bacterium]|nr:SDR family NAD(P)-dependent oxidoreductase [Chloroflexota bacterium]
MSQRASTSYLAGKVCLVTGASRGIAKEIVRGLAQRGATVVMVSRDVARLEAARAELLEEMHGPGGANGGAGEALYALPTDLSLMAEVRRLADQVQTRFDRLDVLVNNAGVTPEGLEVALAVNYLSMFLLTHLLLDRLRQSAPRGSST